MSFQMETNISVSTDAQEVIQSQLKIMSSLAQKLISRGIVQPDCFTNCNFINLREALYEN